MFRVLSCITEQHDLRLVALSASICALGCFTTVMLLARAQWTDQGSSFRWQLPAALIFGCSVWSLHFVAMLAFQSGMPIAFDVDLTALSAFIAAAGALPAFLLQRSNVSSALRATVGGISLGMGVVGMHYVGVAAMRFSGFKLFDSTYVIASIAVSITFAILALARAEHLASIRRRIEVAVWLSIGICGLHFTGMTATTLAPGLAEPSDGVLLGSTTLALIVGSVSLVILVASLAATLMEQHLSQRTVQELGRMRLMSNLAREVLLIHRNGTILEMNNAGEHMFRRSIKELIGTPLLDLFAENCTPALLRRERCKPADRRPEEMEIRTAAAGALTVEMSCESIEFMGKAATAVALRDLSDQKRDEARIRHLARHDPLTDLPNRFSLEERLNLALDSASQDGTGLAVLYFDLDRFKPVNDLLGHAAGDAVLVQTARRLLGEIHPADTLARIGGDEFVLLLTNVARPENVSHVTTRMLEAIRKPFHIDGQRVEIGVSIGVALYPGDGPTAEALMRAADTAMYRVKEEGRGSVRFFETSMNAQLQARRQTEFELAGAVERNELCLFYQPLLNGVTGEVETFEALIRWNHPGRGLVPPGDFIPLAEQSDLIAQIGRWVIDTACEAAASWSQPWRVSVNVSPAQFRQSDLPTIVEAALERNALDPGRLVVEITEGVFIDDSGKALQALRKLRDLGVRLALDDFGTGYSSLSYLQLFKFDKFKIDKSFIKKLGENEEALTIVRTIVNLGHNLGLQVTAEGVETPQQLAVLRELHCDQYQGFLFGRPNHVNAFSEVDRARAKALFKTAHRLSA